MFRCFLPFVQEIIVEAETNKSRIQLKQNKLSPGSTLFWFLKLRRARWFLLSETQILLALLVGWLHLQITPSFSPINKFSLETKTANSTFLTFAQTTITQGHLLLLIINSVHFVLWLPGSLCCQLSFPFLFPLSRVLKCQQRRRDSRKRKLIKTKTDLFLQRGIWIWTCTPSLGCYPAAFGNWSKLLEGKHWYQEGLYGT